MSEQMSSLLVMLELELRRIRHDSTELFARAVQPVLWLAVFGYIVGSVGAIPTGNTPYMDYITPGVLVQSTTFVSIFYGITLVWERDSGILKKLLVTPTSRLSIVLGRSMAAGVRALFQVLVIVPFALIVGVRLVLNPAFLAAAAAVVFLSAGGFASISILIASFMKTRERFMLVSEGLTMPLFFASSALYPISLMPVPLQFLARLNPLSYLIDAIRALLITGDLSGLLLDLGAVSVFLILVFAAASVSFRRIID